MPVLVRVLAPATTPPAVRVVAGSVEIVAVPVRAIPRLALRLKVALVWSVPALNVSWPGVAEAGGLPRATSAPIRSVPALMDVAPV